MKGYYSWNLRCAQKAQELFKSIRNEDVGQIMIQKMEVYTENSKGK